MSRCGEADTVAENTGGTQDGVKRDREMKSLHLVYEPASSIPNSLTVKGGPY